MATDHPELDQGWDTAMRSETEVERLDRNWNSLLQELRVTQTGVQLRFGTVLGTTSAVLAALVTAAAIATAWVAFPLWLRDSPRFETDAVSGLAGRLGRTDVL